MTFENISVVPYWKVLIKIAISKKTLKWLKRKLHWINFKRNLSDWSKVRVVQESVFGPIAFNILITIFCRRVLIRLTDGTKLVSIIKKKAEKLGHLEE